MKRITPFLWFATEAEEAVEYYVGIFPNSRISSVTRYGEGGPGPKGMALTVAFNLDGEDFVALNGQRPIPHTAAISFVVNCQNQKEIDTLWAKLTEGGGEPSVCGWLKDRFGLSWQIVPAKLGELMGGDPKKAERVMAALMQMGKIDLETLENAAKER